jgi:hypothetical protein
VLCSSQRPVVARGGYPDGQTPVSALLKPSHGDCFPQRVGDPDGQTQGSAPTPERCRIGVSQIYPGCGSAGMGAFVGTIRMGRHRGLPLHRSAAASGFPRYILVAVALGWADPQALSGWADTGVCPYTGTLPHRGFLDTSWLAQQRGRCPCNPEGNRWGLISVARPRSPHGPPLSMWSTFSSTEAGRQPFTTHACPPPAASRPPPPAGDTRSGTGGGSEADIFVPSAGDIRTRTGTRGARVQPCPRGTQEREPAMAVTA